MIGRKESKLVRFFKALLFIMENPLAYPNVYHCFTFEKAYPRKTPFVTNHKVAAGVPRARILK